ncbi:MAG: CHAD domain-containing protein [Candidatus Angelobacter sp.]
MTLLEKRMRGLNTDLSATIAKVVDHDVAPKGVHRLRTTIRRIESLVSYAHPDLDKKLERTLEKMADLRKQAGRVRDLDVQADLLGTLGNGSMAKDRKTLAAVLEKKRSRQAKRLESSVKTLQGSKFLTRLDRIAEEAGLLQDGKNRPLAPLEEARAQLAEMSSDFAARQTIKPSQLHEARVTLKRIRYLAELAEKTAEQKNFIRELKSVQDAIGVWHDWEELTASAEKRFSDRVNCVLLREVRAVLGARQSDATSAVNRLFTLALAPSRKPPRSVQSVRTSARYA